ncbi:protease HtpX [Ilumatobacter nonamiensis]|uniref:protease HtpX n=1 Tax=Ilumatobacter nonamiensis TaxID=467093 RepID=UPI0003470A1D|nr:protease HtpX [Ilumatobacter nonamiensis]
METNQLTTGQPKKIGGFATRIALLIGTNVAVIALLTIIASLFGINPQGLVGLTIFAALFGFGGSFISLAMSKKIAKRSTGAVTIVTPQNDTERWLVDTVARLSRDAGIETPEVAVFDHPAPNAFATGAKRNDALVAVSVGLLQQMKPDEVEAVLAHEVAHVANGDMVTLTLIQGVVNTFVILISRILANVIISAISRDGRGGAGIYFVVVMALQVVLGFFATMIVMWFSRHREFRADSGSARLTSSAQMVSALQALQRQSLEDDLPDEVAAFGIRPSKGEGIRKLFSSHPPLDARIAALQNPRG